MKTQLMQDIQESATSSVTPARRPAGRHRVPGPPAPPPACQGPPAPPAGQAAPHADTALPDWLVECLREDGEQADRAERRSRQRRRAASWGVAAVVVAVLAAAGLWLAEESRVDGALGIVANTTPAVTAPAPIAPIAPAPVAPIAAPVRGPTQDAAQDAVLLGAADDDAAVTRAARSDAAEAAPAHEAPAPAKRIAAKSRPPTPAAAPTEDIVPGRRREETRMQCRAHGYDERQCARRACTMTRYGFACRG